MRNDKRRYKAVMNNATYDKMTCIKLFVFDLDDTLWNGEKLYPQVVKILNALKRRRIKIAMISYNFMANEICEKLNIEYFFDKIVCKCRQQIEWQDGKQTLMKDLIDEFDVKPCEVVFYDDQQFNIDKTREIGVHAFNVGHKGLSEDFFVSSLRSLGE
jgi:FMN phosphatase YigB (HAD superfamily)